MSQAARVLAEPSFELLAQRTVLHIDCGVAADDGSGRGEIAVGQGLVTGAHL